MEPEAIVGKFGWSGHPRARYPYCRAVVYKEKGDDLISHPFVLCEFGLG